MIVLKNTKELAMMREAGRITAYALEAGLKAIAPGRTTMDVNNAIYDCITAHDATPSFLGYGGFPGAACISLNNEVIHGIPSKHRRIQEGDIVKIDVGATYKGFVGDMAFTVAVGKIAPEVAKLLEETQRSLELAIAAAQPGNRIGDIGAAVEGHVSQFGFGILRDYVGHGVGHKLHEEPEVPNYGTAGHGRRLTPGMTIAIEPMITLRGDDVYTLEDDWTVVTKNGLAAAHFEHTIAITDNGPVILTRP